ncbi:MAG: Stf0 family sulfotransferase [Octadecabacter sp.]
MFTSDPLKAPGIHEKTIKAYFDGDVYFTGDAPVFDTPLYLLAFSNRSGSNLLASHLRSTPYFGGFHEQLNHQTVTTQAAEGDCKTFPDFIRFASTNFGPGCTSWGFKASWDQIMMLYRFGIDKMYPSVRIIHSTRRNLVEQAVSYMIASQTKQWTSKQEGEAGIDPVYDYALINKLLEQSAAAELHVRTLSVLFDTRYMAVRYEAVTRNPKLAMEGIARFADIDLSGWKPKKPPIAKQATDLNKAFCDRYLKDRKAALLKG